MLPLKRFNIVCAGFLTKQRPIAIRVSNLIGEFYATLAEILSPLVGRGDHLTDASCVCCRCHGNPACKDLSSQELADSVFVRGCGNRRTNLLSWFRREGVAQGRHSSNGGRGTRDGQDLSGSKLWNKLEVFSGDELFRQKTFCQSGHAGGQPFSVFV